MVFDIGYPGNRMLVGGTPEERVWKYSSDAVTISSQGFEIPEADGGGSLSLDLVVNTLAGDMTMGGGGENMVSDMTAADAVFSYSIDVEGTKVDVSGKYEDLKAHSEGDLLAMMDPEALMAGEGSLKSVMEVGAAAGKMEMTEAGQLTVIEGSSSGGVVDTSIGDGQLAYAFTGRDGIVMASGDTVPLPGAQFSFGEMSMNFAMPVTPSDEPGKMDVGVRMVDLAVSDALWSMVDPTGGIPHDPATLIVDITSTAKALVNFMDPELAEEMTEMPWQFEDVTINELRLSAAGAEISASGAAIINNDGPMPMPVGGIDIKLVGVTGLMDKLAAIGLLPPEQAMPAKMMLGMFAVPGNAPDTFTSKIEMDASGAITANGVPLQ
jgi:Uncharacterized protein conserved in bacteria (DUF2125)